MSWTALPNSNAISRALHNFSFYTYFKFFILFVYVHLYWVAPMLIAIHNVSLIYQIPKRKKTKKNFITVLNKINCCVHRERMSMHVCVGMTSVTSLNINDRWKKNTTEIHFFLDVFMLHTNLMNLEKKKMWLLRYFKVISNLF